MLGAVESAATVRSAAAVERRTVGGPDAALVCRDIRKRFGEIEAVKRVSFRIDEGETYGLLGANAAVVLSLAVWSLRRSLTA
jgi:ABC-type uncharacterized transport system ATPase subunit